jgi:hypothetical protein
MTQFPPFKPAVFRPFPRPISGRTHAVIVRGRERTDYRLEVDEEGQKVVFDELSYDEACDFQIVRRPA